MPILRRKSGEPPPDLIFDWHRETGVRRRLAAGLLLSTGVVAGWFYLFHVSLPSADRALPLGRPLRVITTPAREDPAAGRPVVVPSTLASDLKADSEALAAAVPDWPQSWDTRPSPVMELPGARAIPGLPAMLPAGAVLLPPVAGAEPLRLPQPPAPEVAVVSPLGKTGEEGEPDPEDPDPDAEVAAPEEREEISPVLTVESGFGGAQPAASPRWKPELFDDAWPAAGSASFMLAVDEAGRVRQCFPLSIPAGANAEALRPELLRLRWQAAGGLPLRWGTVEVRW